MNTVLIVDDCALLRQAVCALIPAGSSLAVIGQANNVNEALALIEQHRPDVTLLNTICSDVSGLEDLAELRQRFPRLATVVLSRRLDIPYVRRCMDLGAKGYVSKSGSPEEILESMRRVATGGSYLDPTMSALLMGEGADSDPAADPASVLSPSEYRVYRLIGEGMTTRQIAESMKRNPRTIETYKTRIKHKLGFSTAGQLMRRAVLHNCNSADQQVSLPAAA